MRRALPGLDPRPVDHVHCWVTRLPWGDDGVGIWSEDGLTALAGHNLFKQAPALGEALAGTVLTADALTNVAGGSPYELEVSVQNQGESEVTDVAVDFTMSGGDSIEGSGSISRIDVGGTESAASCRTAWNSW